MQARESPIVVAVLLAVCAAQTATSKPPEPESIGVFFYLDSGTQALKPLPREEWKRHRSTGFTTVTDNIRVSGEASSFRIAAGDKATFVFKAADVDAGQVKLFRLTVKGSEREYELGKWKRRDFTPNEGVAVTLSKFGEASYALSPEAPLDPGEYALAMGAKVFTFGVSAAGK